MYYDMLHIDNSKIVNISIAIPVFYRCHKYMFYNQGTEISLVANQRMVQSTQAKNVYLYLLFMISYL